jgi:hypothetical protein
MEQKDILWGRVNNDNMKLDHLILVCFFSLLVTQPASVASVKSSGLTYRHEELPLSMRLGFRIQNQLSYADFDEGLPSREDKVELQIRRLRLKLEGVAGHPNLTYTFQFSFSRGDQDWDTMRYPNILRDGNVTWTYSPGHKLIFGLRKLPGNRQRVISSGAQEFVDRSIANASFNIDRDTGIQSWSEWFQDSTPLRLQLALTSGEGRGQPNIGLGLSTTARVEWLPLGAYTDGGDYFEGDLSFETSPKLSIGIVTNINRDTYRLGGQIGPILENQSRRTIENGILDMNFKYLGWSISSEYFKRTCQNPIISSNQSILVGTGYNAQVSYTFANHIGLGYRYTEVKPEDLTFWFHRKQNTLGLIYYFNRHAIKIQSDFTHENESSASSTWRHHSFRLQFEYGI